MVGLFELIETVTVIKLSADVLVLVNEVVQLLGKLGVLVGQASSVSSQSLTFVALLVQRVFKVAVALSSCFVVQLDAMKLSLKSRCFLGQGMDLALDFRVAGFKASELLA